MCLSFIGTPLLVVVKKSYFQMIRWDVHSTLVPKGLNMTVMLLNGGANEAAFHIVRTLQQRCHRRSNTLMAQHM